jgi:predicted nucleic acid-binding protein
MKAAVDTSVLIALGKLGYLGLVKKLFDQLVIAESVFEEVKGSEVFEQVNELIRDGFARVVRSTRRELLSMLVLHLGKGEAETIALALEMEADVVMLDDLEARRLARRFKMKIVGTLGVIKAFIDAELLKENPETLCERLIEQGFWVDRELCVKVLRK